MSPKRRMQSVTAISPMAQGFSLYMYIKILLNVYIKKELFTRDVVMKNQKIGDKTAESLVPSRVYASPNDSTIGSARLK